MEVERDGEVREVDKDDDDEGVIGGAREPPGLDG